MILGGVFERHPALKFVMTEAGVEWIPDLLADLDALFEGRPKQEYAQHLRLKGSSGGNLLKPSEYWTRQCWAGASFMPKAETDMRYNIGIDKLMWGSDYPHLEGTWPNTKEKLRNAFEDVPAEEVSLMVGGNAIECYGVDRNRLASLAAPVGPGVEELSRPS